MDIYAVFEEIKNNIRTNKAVWSGHALSRLNERFKGIPRNSIIKAIIDNGEIIRFEWQKGYEPRLLIFGENSHNSYYIQ